jgi:4-amino-4-deoxy-L-arabinose transferase-like glycosyltransferase
VIAICHTTPLLAVGTTLMTVDPLLVTFWTAAMVSGWRALQSDGTTRHWLLTGMCLGLAFLSKYSALYQIACWILFFILWKPARSHLRSPGPYLALAVMLLFTAPVLLWNAQHDWITVHHLAQNAQLDRGWEPTLRFAWDFAVAELALLNPVFLIGALWASVAFWNSGRRQPFRVFLFCMGAPVFAGHFLYTFYARVQPNWIAPAVLPMMCLMVLYWTDRWNQGARWIRPCLVTGLTLGGACVLFLHETKLVDRITGRELPVKWDPLRRVRAWRRATDAVEAARRQLLREGREVFLVGGHYGITGLLAFYHPEARTRVASDPLVYYRTSDHANNQFHFWPGYRGVRTGQNALFIRDFKSPKPPPPEILREFESVTDLGVVAIEYHQSIYHRIHLYACRNLLPHDDPAP